MELEEIKQKYFAGIKNKTTSIILNINSYMINNYIAIEKNKQILIAEKEINEGYTFGTNYRDAIVKMLKKNYERNWNIEMGNVKNNVDMETLIFKLKTDVQEKPKIITLEQEPEPIHNRSEILDI